MTTDQDALRAALAGAAQPAGPAYTPTRKDRAEGAQSAQGGRKLTAAQRTQAANRTTASVMWFAAVWTTYLLIDSLNPKAPPLLNVLLALAVQGMMTWLERPVLRGRFNWISAGVLAVDALINAGGLFPLMLRLGETPTASMISTAMGLKSSMSAWPAMGMAGVLGILLAATPEAVWRWRD